MNPPLDVEEENYRAEFVWVDPASKEIGTRLAKRRPGIVVAQPLGATVELFQEDSWSNATIVAFARDAVPAQLVREYIRLRAAGRNVLSIWILGGKEADTAADSVAAYIRAAATGIVQVFTLEYELQLSQLAIDDTIWITSFSDCMHAMTSHTFIHGAFEDDTIRVRARLVRASSLQDLLRQIRKEETVVSIYPCRGESGRLHEFRDFCLGLTYLNHGTAGWFVEDDKNASWLDNLWTVVAFTEVVTIA